MQATSTNEIEATLDKITEFSHILLKSNFEKNDFLTIRANINDKKDAAKWIEKFGSITTSQWIVRKQRQKDHSRWIMHKSWVCQQNQKNKSVKSSRSTNCKAEIDILIKKVNESTTRNDEFLKCTPPLCAVLKVRLQHNHTLNTKESLKNLRISKETELQFLKYFDDGLTPASAIRAHTNGIMLLDNSIEVMANGSLNPRRRTVYTIYNKWLKVNSVTKTDPFEKLKEKLNAYEEQGTFVTLKEELPWAVLVVTEVMKRGQSLPASTDMIFVDSSTSRDKTHITVTTILTVSKAGAIPIATIIHAAQTSGYIEGFSLLKKNYPDCFGGRQEPRIFMTDDSAAVKGALFTVWPQAVQLLCHFHMAQAEWRWLISSASGMNTAEQKEAMKVFQNVMYANTEDALAETIEKCGKFYSHPQFLQRMEKNLMRKDQWVSVYRNKLLTRHNSANNYYAEATVRVLKDVILQQTKSFNIVALVEFCSTVWSQFFVGRLMSFANGQHAKPHLQYDLLCEEMSGVDSTKIYEMEEFVYTVPSMTDYEKNYTLDVRIGVCNCVVGIEGAFCKHQAILDKIFGVLLPYIPPMDINERYMLAQLALGNDCPGIDSFQDQDEVSDNSIMSDLMDMNTSDDILQPLPFGSSSEPSTSVLLEKLQSEVTRLRPFITSASIPHLLNAVQNLSKINSEKGLMKTLMKFNSSSRVGSKRREKINVHPASSIT